MIRDAEHMTESIRVYIDFPDGTQWHNKYMLRSRFEAVAVAKAVAMEACDIYGLESIETQLVLVERDRDGHAEPIETEILVINKK